MMTKVKNWIVEKWQRFKKWILSLFMPTVVASSLVGGAVVDNNINPYVENAREFQLSVIEQLPEQGDQKVMFLKDKPEMVMTKWGDEIAMKIRYQSSREGEVNNARGGRPLFSKNVEWNGKNEKVRGYEIDSENYEFEIELAQKPASNTFDFVIEGAESLEFLYQEPYYNQNNPEDIQAGVVVKTETQGLDVNGNVVVDIPENVVGSYAVYHKSKRDLRRGEVNYATGKAFHIYRPKVIGADGVEEWSELLYRNGVLTVTVSQEFLNDAVYPVIIDPTFGYTTQGATKFDNGSQDRAFGSNTDNTLGETGTIDSVHTYGDPVGDVQGGGAIYNDTDRLDPVSDTGTYTDTLQWHQWDWSSSLELSSGTYIPAVLLNWISGQGFEIYRDSGGASDATKFQNTSTLQDPATWSDSSNKYSIYATYTASGGGGGGGEESQNIIID